MRHVRQCSSYVIFAAIHCELLQFFVRQQSTLAASADKRDIIFVHQRWLLMVVIGEF